MTLGLASNFDSSVIYNFTQSSNTPKLMYTSGTLLKVFEGNREYFIFLMIKDIILQTLRLFLTVSGTIHTSEKYRKLWILVPCVPKSF